MIAVVESEGGGRAHADTWLAGKEQDLVRSSTACVKDVT